MKAVTYIEIDVPFCAHVYGEAPCVAALGVTGEIKCFNTPKTCQDRENYLDDPVTLRFRYDSAHYPDDIDAIPSLVSVSVTPAVVSLGKDLGERGSVAVTFKDHRWPDTTPGFDKYAADRSYDPVKQGTFWGKFRSRQPYLRGRNLRLIRGDAGQSLEQMETRYFIVDSFDFSADGSFKIVAKDVLKLADGDRAQAPKLSNGFLTAGIDADDTAATIGPAGIGDEEYPESGLVAIGGKEICAFTRAGNALTITRGQHGTEAIAHDAQARVQLCLQYEAEDAADILYDLLVNYAGISSDYIPLVAWQTETESFLSRVFSAIIAEPTPVKKLAAELIEDAALSLWWDDAARLLRMRVLRAISTDAATFDAGSYLEESLSFREQPAQRLSQIWRYFSKRNPLEPNDDPNNYRSVAATIDLQAETDYGSAAIHKIFSRWIPFGGRSVADKANSLLLSRFRDPPRKFNFSIFRNGIVTPILGNGYRIRGNGIQDVTGADSDTPIQITRLNPDDAEFKIEAEEMLAAPIEGDDLSNRVIIVDVDSLNLNMRTLHDALYPAPAEEDGEGEDEGVTVTLIIESGVTIGSTSTSVASLIVGEWPDGINLVIKNRGRIQGKGGEGGQGGGDSALNPPQAGKVGGIALYARSEITLDNEGGEIFGGGGGGGGGGRQFQLGAYFGRGGGGGGGAGTEGGEQGLRGPAAGNQANAQHGQPGSRDAGGTGGDSGGVGGTSRGGDGGDGGGPGLAGQAGFASPGGDAGAAGGNPGAAIDGDSFVTLVNEGDIRGPQIN